MSNDYRSFFDKPYLGSWDLDGKGDVTVKIARIERGELNNKGKIDKKPIIFFEGAKKGWIANVTSCAIIAEIYQTKNVDEWVGKRITLFVGKAPKVAGRPGELTDAIQVRAVKPADEKAA
jgi:hypothetical protein